MAPTVKSGLARASSGSPHGLPVGRGVVGLFELVPVGLELLAERCERAAAPGADVALAARGPGDILKPRSRGICGNLPWRERDRRDKRRGCNSGQKRRRHDG